MTGSSETLGPFNSNPTIFYIRFIHLTIWIAHWMSLLFSFSQFEDLEAPCMEIIFWLSEGHSSQPHSCPCHWSCGSPGHCQSKWLSWPLIRTCYTVRKFTFKSMEYQPTSLSLLKIILDLRYYVDGFNSKSNFELRPYVPIILSFSAIYVFYIQILFLEDDEQIVICFW